MCERARRWPGADDLPVHPLLGLPAAPAAQRALPWQTSAAMPARPVVPPPRSASRRRRLWELSRHAHCPVVGTCVALERLRELGRRHFPREVLDNDYQLHSAAVSASAQRGEFAERLQRELDERWALPLQRARRMADADALLACWREAAASGEFAATLWVVLTHPACDLALEERLLNDVHMLQHQVGAAARADLRRLTTLQREHEGLRAEVAQLRERLVCQAAEKADEKARAVAQLQAELAQVRALLLDRDARVAVLQQRCDALTASRPVLSQVSSPDRPPAAAAAVRALEDRPVAGVPPQLLLARSILPRREAAAPAPPALADLRDKAVLCVGGRAASVPIYRRLVESRGARFLHHDGGSEDSSVRLEGGLDAADLVLCQAGCVSHDAYWRVKDHCRRTGKRCIYLARPSASGLLRGLAALAAPDVQA